MRTFIILGFLLMLSTISARANEAESLFRDYHSGLYQIRLIEKSSGNKSSIGSGFQLNESGVIATNYHVISQAVLHPKKYRVEYVDYQGQVGDLNTLTVDVINDLALVKRASNSLRFFNLAQQVPRNGETVYSLGNPRDLGMVVNPGTYNGLKDKSFYPRIHFTGSINPGMSGGPAINRHGDVIGVNVATGGNSIGFLVPVKPLIGLMESIQNQQKPSITKVINRQLQQNQKQLMDEIMSHHWPQMSLGGAKVPSEFASFLPCWGESNSHEEKARFFASDTMCRLGEDIYLSGDFNTGMLNMQFGWLESKDLLTHQFYTLYQSMFGRANADNFPTKEFASDFQCVDDFVKTNVQSNTNVKAVFCTRAYKLFPGLYDAFYISANLGKDEQGLISHFTLAGVDKDNAMRFLKRFMESVTWK